MGTNYYWRHSICTCCQRYDEWHICKSLASFRAHFGEEQWNAETLRYDLPPALVSSWAGWKELLRKDGQVWDEYGDQHDVDRFISDVEAVPTEARRRQYDWVAANRPSSHVGQVTQYGDWLDPDGYSFYGGEFS